MNPLTFTRPGSYQANLWKWFCLDKSASYKPVPCDNNCWASRPLTKSNLLWFRRTVPCLSTSAWQCLLSGGNCYPGPPNTVYTQWSILRHARPPCPVSKHWGFHDVYSVYTGVSLNKTFMNAGSPENWWTRLDFGPRCRTFGILDHFDPSKVNKT